MPIAIPLRCRPRSAPSRRRAPARPPAHSRSAIWSRRSPRTGRPATRRTSHRAAQVEHRRRRGELAEPARVLRVVAAQRGSPRPGDRHGRASRQRERPRERVVGQAEQGSQPLTIAAAGAPAVRQRPPAAGATDASRARARRRGSHSRAHGVDLPYAPTAGSAVGARGRVAQRQRLRYVIHPHTLAGGEVGERPGDAQDSPLGTSTHQARRMRQRRAPRDGRRDARARAAGRRSSAR